MSEWAVDRAPAAPGARQTVLYLPQRMSIGQEAQGVQQDGRTTLSGCMPTGPQPQLRTLSLLPSLLELHCCVMACCRGLAVRCSCWAAGARWTGAAAWRQACA